MQLPGDEQKKGAGWMEEIGMAGLIIKTNKPRKPISSSIVIRMPCLPLRCGTGRVGLGGHYANTFSYAHCCDQACH
jgi:hypothetical protein